jgi:UDP-N-acetylmuramate--alanine ligase
MKILEAKYFHFLGIGGIGMSALARYFNQQGKSVTGYDKTPSKLTGELQKEGIGIQYEDDSFSIPKSILDHPEESIVVYTPAIPTDSNQLNQLRNLGYQVYKRSYVLGEIVNHSFGIAVAGTHGKTTISTLLAHILTATEHGCNAFLGGISTNYKTNYISDPNSNITVVEADEFDRSFLTLDPHMSIISSVDADHLDIYGDEHMLRNTFIEFGQKTIKGGFLLTKHELMLEKVEGIDHETYSILTDQAEHYASNIRVENGHYHFDLNVKGEEKEACQLGLPGRHNVENALAASVIASQLKIDLKSIGSALKSFEGVARRFDIHLNTENLVFIDDYAHHPTEITASVLSAREMFPGRKLTGIFQPHLFSRTQDFADEFARSLELLDEVILLPIYPAREKPIPGVDSQLLLDKIQNTPTQVVEKSELLRELDKMKLDVLMTLGAGDIDRFVEQIKTKFDQ